MILPEIDNLRELKSGADKTSYEQKNNRITVKDVARKGGFHRGGWPGAGRLRLCQRGAA
jgi:hypothetical protein